MAWSSAGQAGVAAHVVAVWKKNSHSTCPTSLLPLCSRSCDHGGSDANAVQSNTAAIITLM